LKKLVLNFEKYDLIEMGIKRAVRKVARKAASTVKRTSKGRSKKRLVSKSSKKRQTRVRPRKNSKKKLASKKKRVSKKTRATRKRARSAKKTTSSRKRRARRPSTKRRGRKKKTEKVVAVDQEEVVTVDQEEIPSQQADVVDELNAKEPVEASARQWDFESASIDTQQESASKEDREVIASDSVSGDIYAHDLNEPVEKDVQTPEQESLPESREPHRVERESSPQSKELQSEPESDYVIVTKEDAGKFSEVGETEETSVPVEEPVLANNSQKDMEPIRNVECDDYQEVDTDSRYEDSSSLPSFGVRDVRASSEVRTSPTAVPLM